MLSAFRLGCPKQRGAQSCPVSAPSTWAALAACCSAWHGWRNGSQIRALLPFCPTALWSRAPPLRAGRYWLNPSWSEEAGEPRSAPSQVCAPARGGKAAAGGRWGSPSTSCRFYGSPAMTLFCAVLIRKITITSGIQSTQISYSKNIPFLICFLTELQLNEIILLYWLTDF